ncbi:MAG: DUF116 domain-containing protein [Methanoregulaceae archaeon]|nr:DUF116 domain-containing protein [Methanoregulaceae archaeon]
MAFDLALWLNQIVFFVGLAAIVIISGLLLSAFLLVSLSLYSIRKGKPVVPGFLTAGLVALEGLSKALFRLFGLEDREVLTFFIQIHNIMNTKAFEAVPVSDRAIFLPQCLRSAKCPAFLTPEGLKCRSCGNCEIGRIREVFESLGYRWFIVPGSSFIKRMVKQYRPKAIIGVGCLTEVKEGLEMADKLGLVAMGVVNLKEGCVETIVDWDEVFSVALLGLDRSSVPVSLITKDREKERSVSGE